MSDQSRQSNPEAPPNPERNSLEDYCGLLFFWALLVVVFVQLFTRYALNDSIAWTEEIARYLLICVGFVGGIMAVRKNTHIQVEFLFRYVGRKTRVVLAYAVDIIRIIFFGWAAMVCWELAGRTHSRMVSVGLSKNLIYYVVLTGLVLMCLRAMQKLWHLVHEGSDNLTDPDSLKS